jgi:hypothetical protein
MGKFIGLILRGRKSQTEVVPAIGRTGRRLGNGEGGRRNPPIGPTSSAALLASSG